MEERVESCAKGTSKEILEVMDTPERSKTSQIAASISKFEDSPVFNFLNSLSPIKPVKSTHITQTINPLSFASIPSVFTSPHVSSLRKNRFLRRHQLSDPSKPEFSSDDGIKVDTITMNDASKQLDEQKEIADGGVAADSSYDCSKFDVDFDKDYECASPNFNLRPGCGHEAKENIDVALVPSQRGEVDIDVATQIDQNKEATSCDWEHMISNTSDLLVFESPNDRGSYNDSADPGSSFFTSIKHDIQSLRLICTADSGEQVVEGNEAENLSTHHGEENEMDNAAGSSFSNPDETVDYENLGFYRGMRRRCLVFEMGGARRKHFEENSDSDSSVWLHSSDGNTHSKSNDQQLVSLSRGNESLRCLVPGIGLHLNALATTPKDYKIANPDSSASARLLIGPSSVVNIHPSSNGQRLMDTISPVAPSDCETAGMENAVLPIEDARPPSGYTVNEEINQGSPKKKRRRSEQAGEGESCKRCNCKRSRCLKLYCECFAAGVYCVEPCACMDCFNKPIHEDTVLATRKQIESRNPLAFAPKVIRGSDSPLEVGDDSSKTPASARHKRGCNCKKSGCLKKYCECFQGGVGCSVNCRCEGCKNAFGRKDGVEAEAEEDEANVPDRIFQKSTEIEVEQSTDSAPPATPLRGGRPSAQLPFSSKKKPPRSSFPSIASSSSSCFLPRQGFGKSSFFGPPPKFDEQFEPIRGDEIPEFLQVGSPESGGIKLSSPKLKRVSPPHNADGVRSSRKLILQSIPSFPSLTQNH